MKLYKLKTGLNEYVGKCNGFEVKLLIKSVLQQFITIHYTMYQTYFNILDTLYISKYFFVFLWNF